MEKESVLKITRIHAHIDRAMAYEVYVDGVRVGKVKNNDSTCIPISPGSHEMHLKVTFVTSNSIHFTIKPGDEMAFECGNQTKQIIFTFLTNKNEWLLLRRKEPNEVSAMVKFPKDGIIGIIILIGMWMGFNIFGMNLFTTIHTVGQYFLIVGLAFLFALIGTLVPFLIVLNSPKMIIISGSTLYVQRRLGSLIIIPRENIYKIIRYTSPITAEEYVNVYYDYKKPNNATGFLREAGDLVWDWYYTSNTNQTNTQDIKVQITKSMERATTIDVDRYIESIKSSRNMIYFLQFVIFAMMGYYIYDTYTINKLYGMILISCLMIAMGFFILYSYRFMKEKLKKATNSQSKNEVEQIFRDVTQYFYIALFISAILMVSSMTIGYNIG